MPPFTRQAPRTPLRGRHSEHDRLLRCVQGIQERSARAVPWEPDTVGLPEPATDSALARINDVAFYANAREEVSVLAGVCADLLRLHSPDADADADTAGGQVCHGCRQPWPCPTFDELARLMR
ncbi:hypothetical protein DFP74_0777 [Nocardiopsis sp. Huas11]|uniref:hypothetical protein n=1 Tax=Nocardiopsis sp. Huas11 TaxID=2183912 RepID=UPI000EAF1670|nr:hypothetical protein [Nocardiopsis sp. Huas11]RKS05184.1 hypothetical protein DFP74_0777 [Nocardiopsis sp. Huas11]